MFLQASSRRHTRQYSRLCISSISLFVALRSLVVFLRGSLDSSNHTQQRQRMDHGRGNHWRSSEYSSSSCHSVNAMHDEKVSAGNQLPSNKNVYLGVFLLSVYFFTTVTVQIYASLSISYLYSEVSTNDRLRRTLMVPVQQVTFKATHRRVAVITRLPCMTVDPSLGLGSEYFSTIVRVQICGN